MQKRLRIVLRVQTLLEMYATLHMRTKCNMMGFLLNGGGDATLMFGNLFFTKGYDSPTYIRIIGNMATELLLRPRN